MPRHLDQPNVQSLVPECEEADIQDSAQHHPYVSQTPAPQVVFAGLGDFLVVLFSVSNSETSASTLFHKTNNDDQYLVLPQPPNQVNGPVDPFVS